MDVEHGLQPARRLVEQPEAFVARRDAVDVAEDHEPGEPQIGHGPLGLAYRGCGIAERQRRQRREAVASLGDDPRQGVVDLPRERHRSVGGLDERGR